MTNKHLLLLPLATPHPMSSPLPPQGSKNSPSSLNASVIEERVQLVEKTDNGYSFGLFGRTTRFVLNNLALIALLVIGLVAFGSDIATKVVDLVVGPHCKVHVSSLGRLWYNCPAPFHIPRPGQPF